MMGDFSSEAYVLEIERLFLSKGNSTSSLVLEIERLEAENEKLRSMLYDFEKGITSARDTLNLTIVKYLESMTDLYND